MGGGGYWEQYYRSWLTATWEMYNNHQTIFYFIFYSVFDIHKQYDILYKQYLLPIIWVLKQTKTFVFHITNVWNIFLGSTKRKKCTKWWKGSNSCPNKKYITHMGLILKHVNVYIPKNIKQPLTFFISLLLRWVPIMIDLRQARDANIIRTLDGRHMTPWARNTSSKISKPGHDQRWKTK